MAKEIGGRSASDYAELAAAAQAKADELNAKAAEFEASDHPRKEKRAAALRLEASAHERSIESLLYLKDQCEAG